MSPGVVVVVFFLVAAAELPDKTMIATIVMGSRNPPILVWAGAAAGLLVQASIAVAAGRLVELLPHQTLEIVVTALFFVGAALLLLVPERRERQKGEAAVQAAGQSTVKATVQATAPETGGATSAGTDVHRARDVVPWKVVTTTFVVIAVGEFGDLTQLLLVNLVGRYHEPWAVFVGGFAGLASMAALAAFGGRALLRWLPLAWIRRAGGLALLGFAAYGIYALVT